MKQQCYIERRRSIQKIIREKKFDAFLVSGVENATYLTGFTGDSSMVLIDGKGAHLITDSRYTEQAGYETSEIEIQQQTKGLTAKVIELLKAFGYRSLGIESNRMLLNFYNTFQTKLKESITEKIELIPCEDVVEQVRIIKDDDELVIIEQAIVIAQDSLEEVMTDLPAAGTEKGLADRLEYAMRSRGASKCGFDTIVGVGTNRSLPHYQPKDVSVTRGKPILVDWGARFQYYNCDLTRTFYPNSIEDWDKEVYAIVLEAQRLAIEAAGPGMKACELDKVARDYITEHGYGDAFGHTLGHGVGMEVHEAPGLRNINQQVMKPGMVVTMEPGIYLPGRGGVRIEDMVLITDDGARVLTSFPKQLEQMIG